MEYIYDENLLTYDDINLTYEGTFFSWIFTPPTDNFLNLTDFDVDTPPTPNMKTSFNLFRHFAALPRGRNVYKLNDGSYIESEPADISTVVAIYYGGHANQIDPIDAASLTASGYGAYIT